MKMKKVLISLFALSCAAVVGYSANELKVANAASTYVDDTAFEEDTFVFIGPALEGVGWDWGAAPVLERSTYFVGDEVKYQYSVTLDLLNSGDARLTLGNSDHDEYKYHGDKTGYFEKFNDCSFYCNVTGTYNIVLRDEASDGFYAISTSDMSSTLYLKVERVYEESFVEQRVESYFTTDTLNAYLNGIKVDDTGRIWWAWEIFNNGGEDINPVDQLKFYVYDEDGNYYGNFTQTLSDQYTFADELQNSLLYLAGVPAGEETYNFKVQLIAKKGYAYSNSDIYDVDGSYAYNVEEYIVKKENLASGKNVITPSNYVGKGSTTANIVDGDIGSGYRPHDGQDGPYVDNPWFVIDLGASYDIAEIKTYFEAACPSKFEVYVTDTEITSNYAGDFSKFNKVGEKEYEFVEGRHPVDSFSLTNTTGRYVIINCLGACSGYGVQLFEVEVFEKEEVENGAVSLYGTQFGKDSEGNTALRFIGRIEDVDLDTYDKQIQIRVTYTCGDRTGTGTSNVDTLYKSLTEKNGTESLPEVENSYYFYLLLTNVPSIGDTVSTYFVEILVDGELVDNATYKHSVI